MGDIVSYTFAMCSKLRISAICLVDINLGTSVRPTSEQISNHISVHEQLTTDGKGSRFLYSNSYRLTTNIMYTSSYSLQEENIAPINCYLIDCGSGYKLEVF